MSQEALIRKKTTIIYVCCHQELEDAHFSKNVLSLDSNTGTILAANNHLDGFFSEETLEKLEGLTQLSKIDFSNNQITEDSIDDLATLFGKCRILNLAHNVLGNEGIHRLIDALTATHIITHLDLNTTCIDSIPVAQLKQLMALPLLSLDISNNPLTGNQTFSHFCQALAENKTLHKLNLSHTEPRPTDIDALIQAMKQHPKLQYLDISGTHGFLNDEDYLKVVKTAAKKDIELTLGQISSELESEIEDIKTTYPKWEVSYTPTASNSCGM